MATPTRATIVQWMKSQIEIHADPIDGSVNTTTLAEDAADHFDLWTEEDYDISYPEELEDWAFEAIYGTGN